MKKTLLSLFLFTCLSLLSACGFQLTGQQDLGQHLGKVYVESEVTYSPMARQLRSALTQQQVIIVDSADQANTVIDIISENAVNRLETTGVSQETRRYTASYTINSVLQDSAGQQIYGPRSVSSSTTHYVYSGQVFGNNQEKETLYGSLRQDVATKMLFILNSSQIENITAEHIEMAAETSAQGSDNETSD